VNNVEVVVFYNRLGLPYILFSPNISPYFTQFSSGQVFLNFIEMSGVYYFLFLKAFAYFSGTKNAKKNLLLFQRHAVPPSLSTRESLHKNSQLYSILIYRHPLICRCKLRWTNSCTVSVDCDYYTGVALLDLQKNIGVQQLTFGVSRRTSARKFCTAWTQWNICFKNAFLWFSYPLNLRNC
jgi:hypothetical protein